MDPIAVYRAAGYPAVAVRTEDEDSVRRALVSPQTATFSARGRLVGHDGRIIQEPCAAAQAFAWAADGEGRVLVVLDLQHVIQNGPIYRALLDVIQGCKARGSMIVMVAPAWTLPAELAHYVPVIDWDLPGADARLAVFRDLAVQAGQQIDDPSCLAGASAGLTLEETESAGALSLVETGTLDPNVIQREKCRRLRSTGYLSVESSAPESAVGGLGELRDWLHHEVAPVMDDPALRVRGALLVGVPGTGKSLSARVAGGILGWPVIRLDLSACRGSLVGQTEERVRTALRMVESISPAVLWLDELEKAVGGYASSAKTDGGTTLGAVGHLLTWLQEHRSPVFVLATCNDYTALPPELTRAGRMDERWFVDLPTREERVEIAAVHLRRLGCDESLAGTVADLSDKWTGAEIESCVLSAARRTRRIVTEDALRTAAAAVRPISRTRAAEIDSLRKWAADSLRPANRASSPAAQPLGRRNLKIGGVA